MPASRSIVVRPGGRAAERLQFETPTPWDSVRHDVYTTRFALAHLARYRPRVLYLALGETDDWAHDGRYDRVFEAYARSDAYLKELWTWLQSQPDYRGRTSLLITTDHGRGRTPADWKRPRREHPGSGDTWVAFVSPDWSKRGSGATMRRSRRVSSPRRSDVDGARLARVQPESRTAGDTER